MNSSLFAFIFSGLFSGSIHAAHLTYILPSPPLLTERGDFSHLLTYAAGILSFRLHEYDDAPDFDTGYAVPSCLEDGSACSLTTDEYKMTLIGGGHDRQSYSGAPSQEKTEYATLTVTTLSDSDIAQFALCDLITLHLREYLYVNIGEEENPDETGYILLDLNQLPVFSVVSTATDDDLSTFLSALSPKILLEKI
uniref:Uncharacterized protein n=2 Tax=Corethron hystrix TaxID=216773 RepID=A0A7S1FN79_9STRA|mmetsp:Transcript_15248/g.34152  ORF Transcript_15248/g.34152 Transcript_15248/m.34152 type:complete len:195 (+) Transcript_15248:163-747(+)